MAKVITDGCEIKVEGIVVATAISRELAVDITAALNEQFGKAEQARISKMRPDRRRVTIAAHSLLDTAKIIRNPHMSNLRTWSLMDLVETVASRIEAVANSLLVE